MDRLVRHKLPYSISLQRVDLLKELIFRLIEAGLHREALDELELCVFCVIGTVAPLTLHPRYLPSFPYQDNPILHIYAGLLCFYLSQENSSPEKRMYSCRCHSNFSDR